jgi:hypothetical protein
MLTPATTRPSIPVMTPRASWRVVHINLTFGHVAVLVEKRIPSTAVQHSFRLVVGPPILYLHECVLVPKTIGFWPSLVGNTTH